MSFKSLLLVLPILASVTSSAQAYHLMMGTLTFPKTVEMVPNVRIYHSGKIIKGTLNHTAKSISFSIPQYNKNQIRYNLLITESIQFAHTPEIKTAGETANIIEHIKVPEGKPYKLYTLLVVPRFDHDGSSKDPVYQWRVLPDYLRIGNKVPDDAVIVLLDPEWIEAVQGTSSIEFPTIQLKADLLTLTGSLEKLYEKSTELLLAAIDSDTMHDAEPIQHIRQDQNRITIAAPVA